MLISTFPIVKIFHIMAEFLRFDYVFLFHVSSPHIILVVDVIC